MKTSSYNDYLLFALITHLDVKADRIIDVLNSQIQRLPHNPRDHHKHKQVCRAEKKKRLVSGKSICGICFDMKMEPEMFRGGDCNHPICSECISKHVVGQIQRNVFNVNCPISNCCVQLKPQQLNSLLPKGVLVRWKFAISKSSIDCPVLVENEDEGKVVKEVKQEKDSDMKVLKLVKCKMPKRCPKCSVYVQKSGGFGHMTCKLVIWFIFKNFEFQLCILLSCQ